MRSIRDLKHLSIESLLLSEVGMSCNVWIAYLSWQDITFNVWLSDLINTWIQDLKLMGAIMIIVSNLRRLGVMHWIWMLGTV